MSQSSLTVGLLALAFVLFIAARGRLPIYTSALWGATENDKKAADKSKGKKDANDKDGDGMTSILEYFDRDGDGFDWGDAASLAGKALPWPFSIPADVME